MNTSAEARVIASITFIVALLLGAWGQLDRPHGYSMGLAILTSGTATPPRSSVSRSIGTKPYFV